jgi:hypothetical protein
MTLSLSRLTLDVDRACRLEKPRSTIPLRHSKKTPRRSEDRECAGGHSPLTARKTLSEQVIAMRAPRICGVEKRVLGVESTKKGANGAQ